LDSPEQKKKLVISAEDLAEGDAAASTPAKAPVAPDLAPTEEVKVTVGAKKAAAKLPATTPKTRVLSGPPTVTPGSQSRPWHRQHRRKLLFGGGLIVALALGFVISFVVLGLFDNEDDLTREALTSSTAAFESSTAATSRARQAVLPFTALSRVADESSERAATIDEATSELSEKVDEARLVRPTMRALEAERGFLLRFGRIANFRKSELARSWRQLKPELRLSQQKIDAARQGVLALNLGDTPELMPANPQIAATIEDSGRIILTANRKIRDWRAELSGAQAQLSSAEGYESEMSGLMDEYYEQRNETQDLVREPRVRWDIAEKTLLAHAAARQGIIERMDALVVPAGVETAHQEMVSLAIESKTLLEEAAEAARVEPYIIWTGTPGWQRLHTSSEAITERFGAAESAVLGAAEQAVGAEKANVARVGPKPRV
jgi:hypothetical protein